MSPKAYYKKGTAWAYQVLQCRPAFLPRNTEPDTWNSSDRHYGVSVLRSFCIYSFKSPLGIDSVGGGNVKDLPISCIPREELMTMQAVPSLPNNFFII